MVFALSKLENTVQIHCVGFHKATKPCKMHGSCLIKARKRSNYIVLAFTSHKTLQNGWFGLIKARKHWKIHSFGFHKGHKTLFNAWFWP